MSRLHHSNWDTIDIKKLKRFTPSVIPTSYTLQRDSGNGCAGDPPGYPSYFTRSVHTSQGNSSRYGPVITYEGKHYDLHYEQDWEKSKGILRTLWKPLPLGHPRTQAWIMSTFSHHRHCYQDPSLVEAGKNWSDAMLIWPGGCLGKTPYGTLRKLSFEIEQAQRHRDYDKWTDAHQEAFRIEIEADNARITKLCEAIAKPDTHSATIIIRRYYPEFVPTDDLINVRFERPGNWWETLAKCPSPGTCPGQYSMKHPVNGAWCQMCGWSEKKPTVKDAVKDYVKG